MDVQSIDSSIAARLMGRVDATPGMVRRIPGGAIAFNSAFLNSEPGQPSLFRFSLQFGAVQAAAAIGNWLFAELHDTAAALFLAGHAIPIDHAAILRSLRGVA
jgi:hypothetical protein